MAQETSARRSVRNSPRTAVVWQVLRHVLGERAAVVGQDVLAVLDLGGGTGGFAVPVAKLGHQVTVVDESADALATLERRATEHAVSVRAVQGDASDLGTSVGPAAVDLVLCHHLLEYVPDPQATLAAVYQVLRPAGVVSVLAPNRAAAIIHRAIGGRFHDAARLLEGEREGQGGGGLARRFTVAELSDLLATAGFHPGPAHGVGVFADLVQGGVAESAQGGMDALVALEHAAAEHVELRAIATALHIIGRRPADRALSAG